ncbi:hypothetical protein [Frateuria defendens]|uniref:hypothetical protein n=1 Tax=Frateuria defendens TaxID=2219559 RepID=UPI00066FC582|nr:hypothetical protein [Frateuria defendens]
MSPFEWLGLPEDADERAVKRAYAMRLRTTRPEDDPQGFQHLHAAYQSALAVCRASAAVPAQAVAQASHARDVPVAGAFDSVRHAPQAVPSPTPIASPAPAPRPAPSPVQAATARPREEPQPRFELEAFCTQAIHLAAQGDGEALLVWLKSQPALWSFRLKTTAGHELVRRLYRDVPPMPAACLHVLLRFFDLDHVHAGHDPLALQRLERRMRLAWELQPAHRDALDRRLQLGWEPPARALGPDWRSLLRSSLSSGAKPVRTKRCLQRLQRPFHGWQGIAAGLFPRRIGEMEAFIGQLAGAHPEDLPPSIPREQLRFWTEAADTRHFGAARLLAGIGKLLLVTALALPLGALLTLGLLDSGSATASPYLPLLLGLAPATAGLLWLALHYFRIMDNWHSRAEPLPARWPRLRLALVPGLCAIGAAGALALPPPYLWLRLPVLFAALWLGLRRYWRRHDETGLYLNPTLMRIGLLVLLFTTGSPALVMGGAAMLAWADDLRRHRGRLRLDAASQESSRPGR